MLCYPNYKKIAFGNTLIHKRIGQNLLIATQLVPISCHFQGCTVQLQQLVCDRLASLWAQSFIRFIHSLTHSFIHSFTHSFIHSCKKVGNHIVSCLLYTLAAGAVCHKTRHVCLSAMTDRILVHCQLCIIPLSRQHFAPNEQQYRQCSYCLSHILCYTTTRQQKLDGHS